MRVKNYEITTDRVFSDKNIAILSDIHISSSTTIHKLDDILIEIYNINPTQIMIPGDLYNSGRNGDYDKVINFLRDLSTISDIYISFGNHELKKLDKSKNFEIKDSNQNVIDIESLNTIKDIMNNEVLKNTRHNIYYVGQFTNCRSIKNFDISISGLTPDLEFYEKGESVNILIEKYKEYLEKLGECIYKHQYNILLTHNPIIIDAYEAIEALSKFNLVISGHNHGGLLSEKYKTLVKLIPNIDINKLYPKYINGMIEKGNTKFLVSEGISKFHSDSGILRKLESRNEGTIEVVKVKKI